MILSYKTTPQASRFKAEAATTRAEIPVDVFRLTMFYKIS